MWRLLFATLLWLGLVPATAPAGQGSTTEQSRGVLQGYARLRQTDPEAAWRRYLSPNLIQHNPEIAEGPGAHTRFMTDRRAAHPDKYLEPQRYANVVDNLLADGDLVAIKSRLFTSPEDKGRAFVDIWRVKHGRLVEHWDVIQPIPDSPINPASMGCGEVRTYAQALAAGDTTARPTCGPAGDLRLSKASRDSVMTYLAMGQEPGHEVEAVRTFVADDFIQHSPHIAPGKQGLLDYIAARAASGGAKGRVSHTARVLADGDLVLVHRWVTTPEDPRGKVYADLFRVRNAKVVEHWDVIQPVPPFSVAGHSMAMGPLEPGRTVGPPPAR
jgi:predicted SnoaL-like aldol condensation-catalyzing enzyme